MGMRSGNDFVQKIQGELMNEKEKLESLKHFTKVVMEEYHLYSFWIIMVVALLCFGGLALIIVTKWGYDDYRESAKEKKGKVGKLE